MTDDPAYIFIIPGSYAEPLINPITAYNDCVLFHITTGQYIELVTHDIQRVGALVIEIDNLSGGYQLTCSLTLRQTPSPHTYTINQLLASSNGYLRTGGTRPITQDNVHPDMFTAINTHIHLQPSG